MQSLDSTLNDIDENDRRTPKLEFSDDDGSDDDLIVSNSHVANRHHNVSESKVSIIIPRVVTQPPSLGDRIIGFIMSGGRDFQSGLTGQPLLYFTSVFVSLGVFLFGYDQGVMSGIITSKYFLDFFDNPSRFEIGSMVAILEIGALISSLLVGRLGDAIGRRKTILYGALIFVVGGAAQSLTTGLISMIIGRTISGFGVGMLSTIVPVYQSEISPPHNRGKLACIEFTGNIVGYASSVWVDYFCSFIESDASWRLPLFLQCVMGALLFAGSFIIVETPRWLLDNDHDKEGLLVLGNLHGGGDVNHPEAQQEFRDIKESVLLERLEGERTYRHMWRRYKKRVLIAMSSQAFAQLNGINGPIKDAARVQERKKTLVEPSLTPQQLQRLAEYEMQKQLQQEYTAVQVVDESQRIQGEAVPLNAGAPDANKSSNKVKIVKTPGGNLRYHHVKKNGTRPKCADTGVPLPGVAALRPREYANISKTKKTVSRAYGGSVSANAVKEKIIRAFLVEEQKVVKRVLKESAEKAKSEEKPKKKSSKK
ncbi:hypothetical protein DV451_004295 [Geotrichum candidum]|uniref:Major facilitator superfamily (MFS) profile domain-containing protein n=1 Tax=Geotrichum candidum TaxID=1173061 RepID=A0A9P5G2T6_GEOCN|nr:hypothetical protein DV451_004295 [Geotrichum candidum]